MTNQPSERWTNDLQVDKDHAHYGSTREMLVNQITNLRKTCQSFYDRMHDQPNYLGSDESGVYFAAQQHLVKLERDLLELDVREHERLVVLTRAHHTQTMEMSYPHTDEHNAAGRAKFDALYKVYRRTMGHATKQFVVDQLRDGLVNFKLYTYGNSESLIPLEVDWDSLGSHKTETIRVSLGKTSDQRDITNAHLVLEQLAGSWFELQPEDMRPDPDQADVTPDQYRTAQVFYANHIIANIMADAEKWWQAAKKLIEAEATEYAANTAFYQGTREWGADRAEQLRAEAMLALDPPILGEQPQEQEVLGLGNL